MSWIEHHENSERLASKAEDAAREGRRDRARALYARAADAEDRALVDLDPSKIRTLGISAASAAWLHYKADRLDRAAAVAHRWLSFDKLPAFAEEQLRRLLQTLSKDGFGIVVREPPHGVTRLPSVRLRRIAAHEVDEQAGDGLIRVPEEVKVVRDEQTAEAVKKGASKKHSRSRSKRKLVRL